MLINLSDGKERGDDDVARPTRKAAPATDLAHLLTAVVDGIRRASAALRRASQLTGGFRHLINNPVAMRFVCRNGRWRSSILGSSMLAMTQQTRSSDPKILVRLQWSHDAARLSGHQRYDPGFGRPCSDA